MNSIITLNGRVEFDPKEQTKKHIMQSSWKKMALVMFDDDVTDYYSWFILKRYNLPLNKPIRGGHVSFINDGVNDFNSDDDVTEIWNRVKDKWNNKPIQLDFSLSPRTNGDHWWLNVTNESRAKLQQIREELHLKSPYFGLHLTIGYPNSKNIDHSYYIWKTIMSFELENKTV